ncbi:von Willebrand factor a domain-containing protein 3b [Plakobranchus ocellatus]|uniref:von Willebrand factor a domain-containing protein 3b n=1 Tax=Plakobranchus ocellatus TaxID=259542 RepID=A0AAV4C3X0_9GAST|nr:von Willebrand factor a domain-containing protein 3b [Plakobranchus ocellatus]
MAEEKAILNEAIEPEDRLRPEPSAPPQEDEVLTTEAIAESNATIPPTSQICPPNQQGSSLSEVEPQPPTMFGLVPEQNVTFCVDTSGSMFKSLPVVKEHLMETLHSLSRRRDEKAMFNLIEFNSQVTQWADKLVQCTPETVAVAGQWVSGLSAKTGTNTQDALLAAFADTTCQAVYLVTDGPPDQYAEEVLDRVVAASGPRTVHCIYIVTGEAADEATIEFLEDLAVETFGSLHVVTLTMHGCVERVTPIYRSDHAHERVVRTVNNTLRPSMKACSVSTTLQIDPDEILAPRLNSMVYPHPYLGYYVSPGLVSTLPERYYYPYYWSRYRPAKAWLQAQDKLGDPVLAGLSPAAGSVLVGKKVLARRIEDGYFYRATVQSQNLGDKFLIAFGPCKHGKYKETQYQDTHVFDIVDHSDAMRHTILTGDRVLAPWEPEGERYAPGIVLSGQEKRHAEGPEDQNLTVSLSNGKTECVPCNIAVWLPPSLYERLSLELQMPQEARRTLLSSVDNYPIENLPGYPASGPVGDPPEYPKNEPSFTLESNPYLWDPYLYKYPPYLPAFYGYPSPPFIMNRGRLERSTCGKRPTSAPTGTTEDAGSLIPGTNMTRRELEDRVMAQLMEHRLDLSSENWETKSSGILNKEMDVHRRPVSASDSRLLGRREKQAESSLKKSVQFSEDTAVAEREENIRVDDRGAYLDDSDFDEYGNPIWRRKRGPQLEDASVNTDSSLLFYHSPGIKGRPRWNYWRNDPSPTYSEISGWVGEEEGVRGPRRRPVGPGPFRETALQAPLEARDMREPPYDVEWASPAFKYVDTFAKHDYSTSVQDCLGYKRTPHPPSKKDAASGPVTTTSCLRSYTVGSRPIAIMTPEEREEARRANRRRRVIRREYEWYQRLAEEDTMKGLMQDQHRERILAQMTRDRERQIQEQQDIARAREAKKRISSELRARIEQNQRDEAEKEERRIEGLKKRRERREEVQAQKDKEIQDTIARREEIRKQNNQARVQSWTDRLNEQDAQEAATNKQHQQAKLRRQEHFRELERQGQQRKDLRLAVSEQQQAIYRSQIFA